MNRAEHLQWSKDRAMECVDRGSLVEGVMSMMSDINKHPETADKGGALGMLGLLALRQATDGDRDGVIRFIKGFN